MSDLVIGLWSAGIGVVVFVTVLGWLHDPYAAVTGPLRKEMKADFQCMAVRLEEEEERRRRLLADLGHELRTPLTVGTNGLLQCRRCGTAQ